VPINDEWIKKMCHIYTMEFYSAIKKNEIMSFARKRMKLEIIMINVINQSHKDNYCIFYHLWSGGKGEHMKVRVGVRDVEGEG
jgi:hypothetical protein